MTGHGFPTEDLARLVDRGPLGYATTAPDGVVTRINTTLLEWLGLRREDVVGTRTFQQLLSAGGRIYFDTHVRPMLHLQQDAGEIALELVRVDGTRLPVLVNFRRHPDPATQADLVEIVVFDATRRRSYERELLREREAAEQAGERLQQLYGVVSALSNATSVDEVVDVITNNGAGSLVGAVCSVWVIDPQERRITRLGDRVGAENGLESPIAMASGPALDELAKGELVVIEDVTDAREHYPMVASWVETAGRRAIALAPLRAEGRLVGAVSFAFDEPRHLEPSELQVIRSLALQTEEALHRARLRDTDRRNRQRLEHVLRFTATLSDRITLDEVVDATATAGMDLLGAIGVQVAVFDPDTKTVEFSRRAGMGGPKATLLVEQRSVACTTIRTGQLIVVPDPQELAAAYPDSPILADAITGRIVSIPLVRAGEVLGAWVLAFAEPGPPDEDDVTLIRLFAEQAGLALRRAGLHQAELAARHQADLRRGISEALNRAVSTTDVGLALTSEARAAFEADALAVFARDEEDPTAFTLVARSGLGEEFATGSFRIHTAMPAVARALRTRVPVFIDGRHEVSAALADHLGEGRWASAAVLPLAVAGRATGLVIALFERPHQLTNAGRVALTGLAAEASMALGRARAHELDRLVAVTLQRSMLSEIPTVGGWRIDAHYSAGTDHLVVGGDVLDVTALGDGRLFVVVGDVVGHGLAAAASMGQLRSAAKALALVSSTPQAVLEGLDTFARLTPGVLCSSAVCAVLDPTGAGSYGCAGHPPPVLVEPGGRTTLLEAGRSTLLGVTSPAPRPDAPLTMEVGASLVLYTDGLVERRKDGIDVGIARLRAVLGDLDLTAPGPHARTIAERLLDGPTPSDDVVVVCMTRTGPTNE